MVRDAFGPQKRQKRGQEILRQERLERYVPDNKEKHAACRDRTASDLIGLLYRVASDKVKIGGIDYLIFEDESGMGHMTHLKELGFSPRRLKQVHISDKNIIGQYDQMDIIAEARPFLEACYEYARTRPMFLKDLKNVLKTLDIDIFELQQHRRKR